MEQVTIPCPCPGTPHPDGDTVGLKPKLGLREGVAVQSALVAVAGAREGKADAAEATGVLSEAYLLHGIAEWTLVDPLGKPLPVTRENIQDVILSDFALALPIADKADELYMESVVRPLLDAASSSLPSTPTNGRTSASNGSTPKPRKPSKRSSTSTTQTGVTATITA